METEEYLLDEDKVISGEKTVLYDTLGLKLFVGDILLARKYVRINKYKAKLDVIETGLVIDADKILLSISGILKPNNGAIIDPMIDKTDREVFFKYFKIGNMYNSDNYINTTVLRELFHIREADPNDPTKIWGKITKCRIVGEEEE